MKQVITGRFEALFQAESAAAKLRMIRANEVEISEWNGSLLREEQPSGDGIDSGLGKSSSLSSGMVTFGFGPNISGTAGISGGVAGTGLGFATSGLGYIPYYGDDQYPGDMNRGYILNALVQDDEQRDKAIRIIREAGGR